MNKFKKTMTGAAAAALVTLAAASPAQAQYRDYDRRDNGIDLGDIVTGVAIAGAAAAAIGVLSEAFDNDRYDRGYGTYGRDYDVYGRNSGPQASVDICAREAGRYGERVEIRDVDRDNGYYRVRGRIEMRDYRSGWNRGYDVDREDFTCYAANGRIYDFRL